MTQKSDLPFVSEFSPSQVDLATVLTLLQQSDGDSEAFIAAIQDMYFNRPQTRPDQQRTLAYNTSKAVQTYGLVDDAFRFTEAGERLYRVRDDPASLYAEFARHILLNLNGASLVQCIQDMAAAGEKIDLNRLREWLEERGIHFPRGGKHASVMKLWLEKAGVFVGKYRVDEQRLHELLGIGSVDIDALSGFTAEQRAYLRTVASLDAECFPLSSNAIEKLAAATYGVKFNEKNLPKTVLQPLEAAGYLMLERGERTVGRGGKPFLVRPSSKIVAEVVEPLLEQFERDVDEELRPLLRKPLAEILTEIESTDRNVRGLALEALAFKLMRRVGLDYFSTRVRGAATGGAEVDVIFHSTRLVFSRWQVQCKNTGTVSLDDVAKEVGLTHVLKSTVIVMVSTGTIGAEARRYANQIMESTNLCVVMIDRNDIEAMHRDPATIVDVFNREARHAMDVKRLEV